MAERSVRHWGKADNNVGLIRPFNPIGSRCANPMMARSNRSTTEAGYTTAADSLCLMRASCTNDNETLAGGVHIRC
jgi:hypothetical protein